MSATHPGELTWASLSEADQGEIARGWSMTREDAGPYFDTRTHDGRREILGSLNGRNGQYAADVARVAAKADPATIGAFDELVGTGPDPLPIEDLAAILARVDAAPSPRYLVRPVIAEGDYGMLAAEFKAGKSWAVVDLAVSVSSATPWLGLYGVENPGPVLLFAGEGGARKLTRRIRAICEARDLDPADLPVRICLRVPHLTSEAALALVEAEIAATRPVLVVIDPLYLAARGARGADLYEMGSHLEGIQHVCQRYGSALLIVTHWNKTGEGRGAKRMTGVGPEAWGRVLISAAVMSRATDRDTRGTSVVLELDFQGDEIAETTARFRRHVWSDDPDDLAAPMHYEITPLVDEASDADPDLVPFSRSARRVIAILESGAEWWTVRSIGDALAVDDAGSPLKSRTIQAALGDLSDAELVDCMDLGPGVAGQWRSLRTSNESEGDQDAF